MIRCDWQKEAKPYRDRSSGVLKIFVPQVDRSMFTRVLENHEIRFRNHEGDHQQRPWQR